MIKKHCPSCHTGYLVERKGKYGLFIGCSKFPACCFVSKLENKSKEDISTERWLIDNNKKIDKLI